MIVQKKPLGRAAEIFRAGYPVAIYHEFTRHLIQNVLRRFIMVFLYIFALNEEQSNYAAEFKADL
jgi:hypothetical protein